MFNRSSQFMTLCVLIIYVHVLSNKIGFYNAHALFVFWPIALDLNQKFTKTIVKWLIRNYFIHYFIIPT